MERAHVNYNERCYADAIADCTHALTLYPEPTPLWREPNAYGDQPARLASFAHEQRGNDALALAYADLAAEKIGVYDAQWDARRRTLRDKLIGAERQANAPAVLKRARPRLGLLRPGAIGDVLMTLNLIPLLKEARPDVEIVYFCHPSIGAPDALGTIMLQAGVDLILNSASVDGWRKSCDEIVTLTGYPLAEGYPDKPMARHLLQYFADELGVPLTNGVPALILPAPDLLNPLGDYATLQTEAGWSKYKQWPHWAAVERALGFPIVRVDRKPGRSLHDALTLVAHARIHLGIDSWGNHASNFYWKHGATVRRTRALILWGSTQASAAGYPQNVNLSLDLACQPCFREDPSVSLQPRGPCINPPRPDYADNTPPACMDGIAVHEVVSAARALWDGAC
jgi:hypothetical protein